ncbi:type II secretion system F family protein [Myceligenerans xiligouense]|uniref:Type II secretion system (T2SS) protein F n=1 Tax=Myceligenerans xiligouense TaxID=253184 RepID=A0A3N4ZCG6_9MICO|nr:type II secretion system F family protein [Myceligenerans xiligouense]RPF23162.1 type II secretion system (T2SS) protein F [Myceligenerans xiligouense]
MVSVEPGEGDIPVLVVGVLVAAAVHLALAPGGRRVSELGIKARPGPGMVPDGPDPDSRYAGRPATADGAQGGADVRERGRGGGRGRRTGRSARGVRGRGVPVRVTVLQVVALLRAGASPGAAWSRAAGVPVDLSGVPDGDALRLLLGPESARAVVAATRLALDVGAPLGQVLESVADSLVRDAEARAERDAALAGPRATARVILCLPAAGAGLGWLLGADTIGVATDGGLGSVAMALGVTFLLAGWAWTTRLVALARGRPPGGEVDAQVVLDLLAAALGAGAGVPRALGAVGHAVGGLSGATLRGAADALVLGARWEPAWAGAPDALVPVRRALRGAWFDGAAPGAALRAAGQEIRRERSAAARTAAARLGVRLVLPLGCCYLPAFVLVGLIPVLFALGIDLLGA